MAPLSRLAKLCAAACVGALLAAPAVRAESNPTKASNTADRITSETWREPEVPPEPHWELLRLPELAMRVAVTPLLPLVGLAERHRLDRRTYDLLTNDERTSLILPIVSLATGDGVGAGVSYEHENLFQGEEELALRAVLKSNGDYQLGFSYAEKIPVLDGRALGGKLHYELDHDDRFYGIGGTTRREDLRLLELAVIGAHLDFELGGPATDLASFGSDLQFGYLRERIRPGRGTGVPAGMEGDSVGAPPGFDRALDYLELTWAFRHDLRDSTGRTSRGTLLEVDLYATSELNGANVNAAKLTTRGALFVPLAPRHRVLVLSGGAAASTPWAEQSELPLHSLPTLGRSTYLRGYAKGRFRDRAAWWTSAEYRYPIFEFRGTGVGLSSTLFVDVGRVGASAEELIERPVRTAVGFGLRGETASDFILRAQLGFSKEGMQALFSLNDMP